MRKERREEGCLGNGRRGERRRERGREGGRGKNMTLRRGERCPSKGCYHAVHSSLTQSQKHNGEKTERENRKRNDRTRERRERKQA